MPSPPELTCPLPSPSSVPHHLCYSTFGNPSDPCLLLVMGLATQMIAWKAEFCTLLANGGYFVVRFDNRDIGRSSHYDHLGPPPLLRIVAQNRLFGRCCPPKAPYSLADMAEDSFQLLDFLEVDRAHVCGARLVGGCACCCGPCFFFLIFSPPSSSSSFSSNLLPFSRSHFLFFLFFSLFLSSSLSFSSLLTLSSSPLL